MAPTRSLRLAAWLLAMLLSACAHKPPPEELPLFRLPPHTLGRSLAWQQRLRVIVRGVAQPSLDALLEADAQSLRLVLLGPGQTLARLQWDGRELKAEQGRGWPREVSAERVLSDMQLALWPLAPLRAALPPGATLAENGAVRVLRRHGTVVAVVYGAGSAHIEIDNQRHDYTLLIDSVALEGDRP